MKNIAVTGSKGKIGSRLVALGAVPLDFDVTDREAVGRGLSGNNFDVIIHAAAISSIAKCEQDLDRAISVNAWGTNTVCQYAGDGKVLFLSTEQVFDGQKGNYSEGDEANPINDYGRTKFGAEGVVSQLYGGKVIRLSRGISRESGNDIDRYIEALMRGKQIHVPEFLKRSYSHLDFLAAAVWDFANNFESMPELVHLGGLNSTSFYQLVYMIAESMNLNTSLIVPRSTYIKDYPRPFNCGLDVSLAMAYGLYVHPLYQSVERLAEEYARV